MNIKLPLRAIGLILTEEWEGFYERAHKEGARRPPYKLLLIIEDMARNGDPEALRFVEAFVAQELLR